MFILFVILTYMPMYIYQITRSNLADIYNTQRYVCLRDFRLTPRSSWELRLRINHYSSRNNPDERSSVYVYRTTGQLIACNMGK